MFKKCFSILTFCVFAMILPLSFVQAQGTDALPGGIVSDKVFEARVTRIIEEQEIVREGSEPGLQQNIELLGLTGDYKDQAVVSAGIGDFDIFSSRVYGVGDRVLVSASTIEGGETFFQITDYVRRGSLWWLALLFAGVIVAVSRKKGLKAILSLVVSFIIISKFILPLILAGYSPLVVGLIGAFSILLVIIYLTDGFHRNSHLAVLSVFLSMLVTLVLTIIFTKFVKLSGFSSDEAMFLMGATKQAIDFQGLLLAGILIGTVGVLDDVIIGQIESVRQINEANPIMSKRELFRSAYKVGNAHLGAIINTLFLTYTGASLPLLLLFNLHQEPFATFSQVLNNESIATEIVRTLVGSIGVALSLPIATLLATYFSDASKAEKHAIMK